MKLLFAHQNFPGQYLHLARHLGAHAGNEVVFLEFPELFGYAGLELNASALSAVVELKVPDERGLRVDILPIPDLAPAVVAQHDIGHEARLFERESGTRDFLAIQHSRLGLPQVMVRLSPRLAFPGVEDLLDSRQSSILPLSFLRTAVSVR
jgi:hypothetical protein